MGFGSSRHADTNCNGDAYTNCYRYCHCYCHCDSHTNGNSDSHGNVYIHTQLDPTTYTFAKAPPTGKNSANAAASSLAGGDWREMSQGREAPMRGAVVL
jgi:hypothetical protein